MSPALAASVVPGLCRCCARAVAAVWGLWQWVYGEARERETRERETREREAREREARERENPKP